MWCIIVAEFLVKQKRNQHKSKALSGFNSLYSKMSLSITIAALAFSMQIRSLVELYTTMGRTIKERFKTHHIILLVVAMVSSLLLSMYMLYSFDNTVLATMAILLMCIFNIGGDSKFKKCNE